MKDDKRSEQHTPHSSPAPRPVSDFTPWHHIVSVSMGRPLSTWSLARVRTEFYPGLRPTLVCVFTDLERMRWMPSDLARIVSGITEMQELIVDQTMVGRRGAEFFKGLARLVRVSITPPAGEGGGGHLYEIGRTELINDLSTAIQGGTEDQPVEVKFEGPANSAELLAEIKSAPDTNEHSDMLLSVAILLWYVRRERRRFERIDRPPPRILHARRDY
jgi:hypothetical protein